MISLFGLSFVLFILRLSYGSNFWQNLRNDNPLIYKQAVKVERLAKKISKQELDIKFLVNCRDEYVYPKFRRWKNVKSNSVKHMNRFYRKILLNEISSKHRPLNEIRKQYQIAVDDLNGRLTYFKQYALKIAINRAVRTNENITMKRHLKKFNALLYERNERDGLTPNRNRIITNMSSHILSNDEYNILQYGLKHGISTSPKSSTVLAYSEDIWDQIRRSNIHYNSEYAKMKIKNAL